MHVIDNVLIPLVDPVLQDLGKSRVTLDQPVGRKGVFDLVRGGGGGGGGSGNVGMVALVVVDMRMIVWMLLLGVRMKVIQATRMVVPGTCLVSTTGTTQAHFFGSMATLVVVQLVPIIFLVIVCRMTMPTLVIALLHIVQDRLRPFVQLFGVPLLVTLDLDQYVVGHQDDGKEAD